MRVSQCDGYNPIKENGFLTFWQREKVGSGIVNIPEPTSDQD